MSDGGEKNRYVGFQVHQKSSKSARMGSGKKMLKLGTPIEFSTKRQKNQAIVALVWSMLALTPVKKSTALLQTTITFVPSLRLGCFFVLIAAKFGGLSEKRSRAESVLRTRWRGAVSTAVGFLLVYLCL